MLLRYNNFKFYKRVPMKYSLLIATVLTVFSGCSATWSGVQEDTSKAADWTKEKVNQGASYVKEKTE